MADIGLDMNHYALRAWHPRVSIIKQLTSLQHKGSDLDGHSPFRLCQIFAKSGPNDTAQFRLPSNG